VKIKKIDTKVDPRLDTGGWLTLTKVIADFFPTGPFTLQDTPSFARCDNVKLSPIILIITDLGRAYLTI
jgi:hypothetical protein